MKHGIVFWFQIALLFGIPAFIIFAIVRCIYLNCKSGRLDAKMRYDGWYVKDAAKDIAVKELKAFGIFVLISLGLASIAYLLADDSKFAWFFAVGVMSLMYLPGIFSNLIVEDLNNKNKRVYKKSFAKRVRDDMSIRAGWGLDAVGGSWFGLIFVFALWLAVDLAAGIIQLIAYYPMLVVRIILWIVEACHKDHTMNFYYIERMENRGTLISFAISVWFIAEHADFFIPML